jgi:hypothetical protein
MFRGVLPTRKVIVWEVRRTPAASVEVRAAPSFQPDVSPVHPSKNTGFSGSHAFSSIRCHRPSRLPYLVLTTCRVVPTESTRVADPGVFTSHPDAPVDGSLQFGAGRFTVIVP